MVASGEFKYFCPLCATHVLDRSKHCRVCNRCVDLFDHHCNWLNNCIGRKNYPLFLVLLLLVGIFSVLQCASNIIVIATLHFEEHRTLLSDFYNTSELSIQVTAYILLGLCTVLEITFTVFVLQLIFLHKWLIKHDLTTYDYIMYLREKARNPDKKIDIMSMKGKHKSKLIQKVKNDSDSPEPQPEQGNATESKSTWQKMYAPTLRSSKDLFGCGSESSRAGEEQRMELPRTIVDPSVRVGREIEFAQDRWM